MFECTWIKETKMGGISDRIYSFLALFLKLSVMVIKIILNFKCTFYKSPKTYF